MSRSGRIPIKIPENTEVSIQNGKIFAKGKLGESSFVFNDSAKVKVENGNVLVSSAGDTTENKQMWGTIRSRINNLLYGVSIGFVKELQLNGVGYKAALKGNNLELMLGFSHPVNFEIPKDLNIQVAKPTEIKISGIDKQRVGQIAANIRSYRKPEPYKGKGVKYKDEIIRRKEGKKK